MASSALIPPQEQYTREQEQHGVYTDAPDDPCGIGQRQCGIGQEKYDTRGQDDKGKVRGQHTCQNEDERRDTLQEPQHEERYEKPPVRME